MTTAEGFVEQHGLRLPLDQQVYLLNGERLWCMYTKEAGHLFITMFDPGCDNVRFCIAPPDGSLYNDKNVKTDFTAQDLEYVGCIHVEPEYSEP